MKVIRVDTIFLPATGTEHLCKLSCGHERVARQNQPPKHLKCFECESLKSDQADRRWRDGR